MVVVLVVCSCRAVACCGVVVVGGGLVVRLVTLLRLFGFNWELFGVVCSDCTRTWCFGDGLVHHPHAFKAAALSGLHGACRSL